MSILEKVEAIASKSRSVKAKELGEASRKDLNELLNFYFSNFEENKQNFDKINLEWKKHCYNINNRQKLITIKSDSFEVEVARIIEETPEFKDNQIVDLTKLNSIK